MKILKLVFCFAILFFFTSAQCYESFDYTPFDDNGYIYDGDDNYGDNYFRERERLEEPPYRQRYSRYSDDRKTAAYSGPGKTFVFDPKALRWYAFYNGELINSGRASGGKYYCPDIHRGCKTPVGVFRISHKGGPDCKSSKYPVGRGNAPMPWCMFFRGGYAIHGSWHVPGYNASHGCIRVPPPDARWLNTNFLTPGSKVIVKSYR